jgi:hypothetical protein
MIPKLFLYILLFQEAFDVNLSRFVKLIFLFLFDVFIYHIIDLFVGHIILLYFLSNLIEHTLMSDSQSQECLLELLIR